MKKIVSSMIIVLLVLTLSGSAGVQPNTSVQLSSDSMSQVVGGRTFCGAFYGMFCCCIDIWVLQFCFCID
jgi:hypothetical protein